jgi:imidazolonepropionase-like amidohydrolase
MIAYRARTNSSEADSESGNAFVIRADVVIPGRGDPLHDGAVVVRQNKIEWVGKASELPHDLKSLAAKHVPVLMPGLWDVHTHFDGTGIATNANDSGAQYLPGYRTLVGAASVDDLRRTLMAGFTSVVELGGYAGELVPAVEGGHIVGPNIYSAFAALGITGGHSDQHDLPLETVKCGFPANRVICDGETECLQAVRQVIRRGAKIIKVMSTGGVLSINDQPTDSQFSPAELRVMVDEAARSSRVVASHAIGRTGIVNALNAGVLCIEHGCYLDEEVAELMKAKGATLVLTRHAAEYFMSTIADLPPKLAAKLLATIEAARSSAKLAIKTGVKIACGTDTGISDPKSGLSHGKNAMELHWLCEAGMEPLQAIESATANCPETLGGQAPKSGQLRPGFDADMIALCKDPLKNVDVFLKTENITHVWKGGKLFKQPPL